MKEGRKVNYVVDDHADADCVYDDFYWLIMIPYIDEGNVLKIRKSKKRIILVLKGGWLGVRPKLLFFETFRGDDDEDDVDDVDDVDDDNDDNIQYPALCLAHNGICGR